MQTATSFPYLVVCVVVGGVGSITILFYFFNNIFNYLRESEIKRVGGEMSGWRGGRKVNLKQLHDQHKAQQGV